MEITWLGAAGFIIKSNQREFAFDPFLSRGKGKKSPFSKDSFTNTEAIYVGHGHFDHTFDIPEIMAHSEAHIFAPGLTGLFLKARGVRSSKMMLADSKEYLNKELKMRAFHSSHVRFDWPLVSSTVRRCGVSGCLHTLKLGVGYPKGLVQTYMFEDRGKKILFISSAGCTQKELKMYRELEIDFLLAPLQGHSRIQELVAEHIRIIQPKVVIPHHHDDFYPPLSQEISVDEFRDQLKRVQFSGDLIEIGLFESAQI